MDFEESDHIKEIRRTVRAVCARYDDTYWYRSDSEHRFPWEFYQAMAEGGWIGIAIPEAYGGGGGGVLEASVVLQEVAESGAAMNGASAIHLSIFGMHPVVLHGSEELKQRYLPRVASGELHIAFGVTEPDAGTETTAIRTSAVRDGDTYRVRGRKVWTSKALEADKVLLLVRTTPAERCTRRTEGLTLLLADLKHPAVTISPIAKAGRNAVASCETVYDDLPVSVGDRVGEEGRGLQYLFDGLNAERVLIAVEAIGTGRVALRRAARYATTRVVHGSPIGSNQGVAFPLAAAYSRLEAAEMVARRAAWLLDQGLPAGADANMAKYLSAEAGFEAADAAMQTHGGYGFAEEYQIARFWREARLMKIAPLPQELALAHIAQHVLGLPRTY
ncbi:acyl-CoA/acyl-ACP dehydrogenase [Acidiferrimicrobium sp. IK]|uniref:acyl-CoA dehydrogenase family protein n=1 Tax=Acidiferrimicrobium sp. IK TaxID=2871700 RepID=UPI0021CB469F|nr:acyl-CoA dehydrogenase family protein [Acidiferrimicrobium sp. IK]MCU4183895.1 acyl-CoA/acyl-ACP dehydrogenase [Acidiferrimicrobium sp. IK]